jgi:hypothetical protein
MAKQRPGRIDPFYVDRAEKARDRLARQPRLTASKAIRAKCLDCSGDNSAEIRRCQVFECPLWRYRMGCSQRTAERRRAGITDPVRVMLDGHKTGMRECGKRTWINPLTGDTEPLTAEIDSEG